MIHLFFIISGALGFCLGPAVSFKEIITEAQGEIVNGWSYSIGSLFFVLADAYELYLCHNQIKEFNKYS